MSADPVVPLIERLKAAADNLGSCVCLGVTAELLEEAAQAIQDLAPVQRESALIFLHERRLAQEEAEPNAGSALTGLCAICSNPLNEIGGCEACFPF